MSKIISSPVKHFPGTVTIAEPLNFAQWVAWRSARDNTLLEHERAGSGAEEEETLPLSYSAIGLEDAYAIATVPGVCACVEAWNLENWPEAVTPGNFPATPRVAVAQLLIWLAREIDAVAFAEGDDPNG